MNSLQSFLGNSQQLANLVVKPGIDILIVGFLVIAGFLYGIIFGRSRIFIAIVSLYIARVIFGAGIFFIDKYLLNFLPYQVFAAKAALFLAIALIVFEILSRSFIGPTMVAMIGSWWQILLFCLLGAALATSFVFSFVPPEGLGWFKLSPAVKNIFLSDVGQFWWAVLPIVAIIIFKGKKSRISREE